MVLGVRLIAAMTGLGLLSATAPGLLAAHSAEAPILSAGLAVAGILVLGVALGSMVARGAAPGAAGIGSSAFDRLAAELRDKSAALMDETSRRQASELALERCAQRERMLAAAVQSGRHAIVTVTPDGAIKTWNPGAERLFGFTAAEAIGNSFEIVIPADRRDEHLALLEKSLGDEAVENLETVRATKGGRRIEVSVSARPVKSSNGEIVEVAKITRDLTEQRFAEEKLRLAVESCPSGMVMVDRTGKIVMVNAEIERLFGYPRDELIGQPIEIVVPLALRSQHVRHRDGFMRHPRTHNMGVGRELFGLRKDGTEFPIEVVLNSIQASEGRLVLGVIVDISERKRLQRLKDEFVSTVSHELRTPLTSISGSLGLLVGGATGKLPDSAERLLAIAQSNSQRLVRLVNDILDIEKMESNRIAFNFKRVEARTLVEQVIDANRGFADGYGVRVRLEPASAAGEVHADPDRLAQVVTNLLSNAIKFSPPNGEVMVSVERRDHLVRISVRDHGPGIPVKFRPHIFEKFAQADATDARRKGGTGLGLSIVKEIVDRLGGRVHFEDAPGGGTVFHVDLTGRERVTEWEIDPDVEPGACRIFLCADDHNWAINVHAPDKQIRFATDLAHIRTDALTRAVTTPYRAILVDLDLPDREGIDLVHDLRSQPQNVSTPIIGLTADARRDQDTLTTSELDDWVDKPVDIDRLAQILDRAVVRETKGRPHILHVDDDPDVLDMVARALATTADVVSVDSIEQARQALADHHFDLAVLDIELGPVSGLDLLPELRTRKGRAIPVIIFSAHAVKAVNDARVQASLGKSRAALDSLVTAVHDRLMPGSSHAPQEII
jgi:PAS domain S-box-containing protein